MLIEIQITHIINIGIIALFIYRIDNSIIEALCQGVVIKASDVERLPGIGFVHADIKVCIPPELELRHYSCIVHDAILRSNMEIQRRAIHDPESIIFKRHSLGYPPLRGHIADIGITACVHIPLRSDIDSIRLRDVKCDEVKNIEAVSYTHLTLPTIY